MKTKIGILASLALFLGTSLLGYFYYFKPTVVTVCMTDLVNPFSISILTAIDHKFFEKEKLDVKITVLKPHPKPQEFGLAKKGKDYIYLNEVPTMFTFDRGVSTSLARQTPVCEVGITKVISLLSMDVDLSKINPEFIYYMKPGEGRDLYVAKDGPVKTVQDLANRKVDLKLASSFIGYNNLLRSIGAPKTAKKVNFKVEEARAEEALLSGEVEATVAINPRMGFLMGKNNNLRLLVRDFFQNYVMPNMPFITLATNHKSKNKPELFRFKRVMLKTRKFLEENPGVFMETIRKHHQNLIVGEAYLRQLERLEKGNFRYKYLFSKLSDKVSGKTAKEHILHFAGILKEAGYIKELPDISHWK